MELDSFTRQSNKKRSLDDESSDEVGNKNIKIDVTPLNPVVFYPAFPHIAEKIFDKLGKKSLRSCREVSKSWLDSIDNRNLLWNEILKNEDGNKAFQLACKNGHAKMLGIIFKKSTEFNIDFNAKDFFQRTAFHCACKNDLLKIAEMIIQKSVDFGIDLNAKDAGDKTAFHLVCKNGHLKIAEMIIQKSADFGIDLST